jgi:hypothetical protein
MSAAPAHPARPPPGTPVTIPGYRHPHGAAGSSRIQVVVLAAARLRALHLDPLVTGSDVPSADHPAQEEQRIRPLVPAPVFIERLELRLAKII